MVLKGFAHTHEWQTHSQENTYMNGRHTARKVWILWLSSFNNSDMIWCLMCEILAGTRPHAKQAHSQRSIFVIHFFSLSSVLLTFHSRTNSRKHANAHTTGTHTELICNRWSLHQCQGLEMLLCKLSFLSLSVRRNRSSTMPGPVSDTTWFATNSVCKSFLWMVHRFEYGSSSVLTSSSKNGTLSLLK